MNAPPTNAPLPQAAPNAQTAEGPSTDDRILAGLCHVSILIGFPVIGPLGVYLWKRETSRFVAFHALQAAICHFSIIPLMMGSMFFGAAINIILMLTMQATLVFLPFGIMGAYMFGLGVPWLGVIAFSIYGGYRAYSGQLYRLPIAGRLAEKAFEPPTK